MNATVASLRNSIALSNMKMKMLNLCTHALGVKNEINALGVKNITN
jgi:hypothetical protein